MEPNERRRQIPPFVWLLVAVSICLWTAVLLVELARLESFDAYWFLVIPKVQGILSSGHLEIATYTPGWEAILSELVLVLGLPLDKLVFLPLGGFLLILPAYAFSRRIRMPPVSAILMTCFITLEVASIPVNYSVFADAWASPMLFLLLLSFIRFEESPASAKYWVLVMAILFLGLHMLYYSTELLAVLFLAAFAIGASISRVKKSARWPSIRYPRSLTVALLALFLVFNELIYQGILSTIPQLGSQQATSWLQTRIASILGISQAGKGSFLLTSSQNVLVSWILIAEISLILAPALIFVGGTAVSMVTPRRAFLSATRFHTVLMWSVIASALLYMFAYFILGLVLIRPIFMLLPYPGYFVLDGWKHRRKSRTISAPVTFMVVLLLLSGLKFVGTGPSGVRPSTLAQIEPGASWLMEFGPSRGSVVLTDLYTTTRFALTVGDQRKDLTFSFYDPQSYGAVVGLSDATPGSLGIDFLVVDLRSLSAPTLGFGWNVYEPLAGHYPSIMANPALAAIYDDSTTKVFAAETAAH